MFVLYKNNNVILGIAIIINNYEFYKEMIAITNSGPQTLRVIQKGLRRDGSIEDTGTKNFMCIIFYPSKPYSLFL